MTANDSYVLGRPKIDEIVVKFIEDAGTLQANLMAGSVDMALGRNLSGPQTLQVKTCGRTGRCSSTTPAPASSTPSSGSAIRTPPS